MDLVLQFIGKVYASVRVLSPCSFFTDPSSHSSPVTAEVNVVHCAHWGEHVRSVRWDASQIEFSAGSGLVASSGLRIEIGGGRDQSVVVRLRVT